MSESSNSRTPMSNQRTGALLRLSAAGQPGSPDGGGAVAGSRLRTVRVASIASNPDNPVSREDDHLPPLRASMASLGMLKPLLVTSRATWMETHPEKLIREDADWVNIDGHRRLLVARELGLDTVEVIVDAEAAAKSDAIMVATHRTALAMRPIDEALAYRRELDRGLSQRKVAERMGVSAATVNKRVALLRLPSELQQMINVGAWLPSAASRILDRSDDVLVRVAARLRDEGILDEALRAEASAEADDDAGEARFGVGWRHDPVQMCHEAQWELRQERAKAAAAAKADELGAVFATSAGEVYRDRERQHDARLTKEEDIVAAKDRGALAVVAAPGWEDEGVVYLRTDLPEGSRRGGEAVIDPRLSDRSRKQAAGARAPFVERLVVRRVSAENFRRAALALTLGSATVDYRVWAAAESLWAAAGHEVPAGRRWRPLRAVPPEERERAMWTLFVAAMEFRLKSTPGALPHFDGDDEVFLALLGEVGYVATDWELARLEGSLAVREQ